MRVICVDNFNREGPGYDDKVICVAVDLYWANKIADSLNAGVHPDGPYFYKAVADEYKLKEFEP